MRHYENMSREEYRRQDTAFGKEAKFLAARIRRAIASAVRKERERCVKCAEAEAVESMKAKRFVSAYRIIKAINGGKR